MFWAALALSPARFWCCSSRIVSAGLSPCLVSYATGTPLGLAGEFVPHPVPKHSNLLVTRTLSKAHSLAGFRLGYALLPEAIAHDLNSHNDAYPLAWPDARSRLYAPTALSEANHWFVEALGEVLCRAQGRPL